MDAKAKEKILRQADAIKLYEHLVQAKLQESFQIELTYGITINVTNNQGGRTSPWAKQIASMIFVPLLEQGLDRYREEVQKVAETGEMPVA